MPGVRCPDKQHSLICTYSTSFHTGTKERTIPNEILLWNSTWHNSSDYYSFILNRGCDLQNTACKQENIEKEKLSTFCTDAVNASVCFMTKPVSLEDTTHVCFKQISQKKRRQRKTRFSVSNAATCTLNAPPVTHKVSQIHTRVYKKFSCKACLSF